MNTYQDTSRAAHEHLQDTGKAETREAVVLRTVRRWEDYGRTLFELVGELGWPVNCITGRVRKLVQEGKVRDSFRRRENPNTGKSAIVWVKA